MTVATRSWTPYLTDRDLAHLEASHWSKDEEFGFGTNPAVLVIDDYYTALGTERLPLLESVVRYPSSMGLEGWAAIDKTVELLDSARKNSIPVIYVAGTEGIGPWARMKGRGEWKDKLPE